MKNLQKLGGIAALGHTAALVVGMVLSFTVMFPLLDAAPDQALKFLADNPALVVWHWVVDGGSAITFVIMLLALYERLKPGSPALMQAAVVFGLLWAGLTIGAGNLMLHHFGVVANLHDSAQPRQQHGRRWYAAYGCCCSAWSLCAREDHSGRLATWACSSASRAVSR